MMKFKLLTNNDSKNIYSFDAIDGEGTFSIDRQDNTIELLSSECRLPGHQLDEKTIAQILYIGKKKILELNYPDSCIYATH